MLFLAVQAPQVAAVRPMASVLGLQGVVVATPKIPGGSPATAGIRLPTMTKMREHKLILGRSSVYIWLRSPLHLAVDHNA